VNLKLKIFRGSGNTLGTRGNDYDINENPNLGFCIAAKLK
jgi:hypothetical protein